MMPIVVSGIIIPWNKSFSQGHRSNYKLVTKMGTEYFLVDASEWEETLSWLSWEEVKVRGLLNFEDSTIRPKKIYPKDPSANHPPTSLWEDLDRERNFDLNLFGKMVAQGYPLEPRLEEIGGAVS